MTNELTVQVKAPVIPAMSWNEAEVRQNLDEMLEVYTGRVYTADQIKSAKEDRAAVNRMEKQLAAASTAAKKLYMKPLEDFQSVIKELQSKCKEVSGAIDAQVKAVEAAEKEEKRRALELVFADNAAELAEMIPFDRLLVPQWLNKSYELAKASRELRVAIETKRAEIETIRESCGEDAEACITEYLRNLSVSQALAEHSRRIKAREAQKAAREAKMAAERLEASSPVTFTPDEETREIVSEARQTAQVNQVITPDGRLDFSAMRAAAVDVEPIENRKRYRFWVEFTQDDIAWFKQGAAERGFRFGSIKENGGK